MVVCVPAHATGHFTPQIPVDLGLAGRTVMEKRKSFAMHGFETWEVQPVAQSLYRLQYCGSWVHVQT